VRLPLREATPIGRQLQAKARSELARLLREARSAAGDEAVELIRKLT